MIKMMDVNIFNANTTKTATHTVVHGPISTSHQSRPMTIPTTSQFTHHRICWKWKAKPMICCLSTVSCIMTQTSTRRSTFLIPTQLMVLAAAGLLRRVSDQEHNNFIIFLIFQARTTKTLESRKAAGMLFTWSQQPLTDRIK